MNPLPDARVAGSGSADRDGARGHRTLQDGLVDGTENEGGHDDDVGAAPDLHQLRGGATEGGAATTDAPDPDADGSAAAEGQRRGTRERHPNRKFINSSDEEEQSPADEGDSDSDVDNDSDDDAPGPSAAADGLLELPALQLAETDTIAANDRPRRAFSATTVEFAAGVTEHGLSAGQADWVLSFIVSHSRSQLAELPRQYRTAVDHNRRWSAWLGHPSLAWPDSSSDALEFREAFVELDGKRVTVQVRDAWVVLVDAFLRNPSVASLLHFGYTRELSPADGSELFSEMWTGHWWRDEEAKLQLEDDLLAVILHLDDTPYWNKSVAPLFLTLGNLPMASRRQHDRMAVVAFVPRLVAGQHEKGSTHHRRLKRVLLHGILHAVLRPLQEARTRGGFQGTVAGFRRQLMPAIATVVDDNESKAVLSLTYKKKDAQLPCHACVVPRAELV